MTELPFTIKPVDASCADMVPLVFRSIYGDNFPLEYVYDGDRILAEIHAGRLKSSLALDIGGLPIGYIAMYMSVTNPGLWEACNLLVVPGRGSGDLAWALLQRYLHPENRSDTDCDGIFEEAVCHHYFTQLGCSKLGFIDCALVLDHMNGASFRAHAPETERVACLLQFYEQSDQREACYLPEQYSEFLQGLFAGLRPRAFLPGSAPLPVEGEVKRYDKSFAAAGMWRVSVSSTGGNWGAFLDDLLVQARLRQVVSLQIVLSVGLPCTTAAVAQMRQRGFFLGGIFPRWFGADGIMMQQVLGKEPDYEGIKLYGAVAKSLLTYIQHDRETVTP